MKFKVTITHSVDHVHVEWFYLLSAAMHILRECVDAKVACTVEYFPA